VNLKKKLIRHKRSELAHQILMGVFFQGAKNADKRKKQVIEGPSITLEPLIHRSPYMASPPLGISNIELYLLYK
jgi:hypothetical protein